MVLYYLARFFHDFILVYPFYSLIFLHRGQTEAGVGWLLAIWSLSAVLLEIPAGLFSDRMNRKNVLLLSAIAKALAFVLWIPDSGFILMASGFVLWGLSEALVSGTEEAWIFETLAEKGRKDLYTRIKGRGNFFGAIAIAVASPLGGYISRYGMHWVLYASVASCVISFFCILGFGKPPRTALPDDESEEAGNFSYVIKAWKEISGNRIIGQMVIIPGVILIVAGVIDE